MMADVMSLLGAEPQQADSLNFMQPGPDIPALREQLAIMVSTGKAKEAIGVQLTQDKKYYKYGTSGCQDYRNIRRLLHLAVHLHGGDICVD